VVKSLAVLAAFQAMFGGSLQAENWPNWRGPTNNGISTEKNIAIEWSPTKNVAWKVALPGPAGATPVVWDDRIFLTTVTSTGDLQLLAYKTDGTPLWVKTVSNSTITARGDEGNAASPSPVTDGQHVWAFFGDGALICVTVDGKDVWKFNVQDRYGKFKIQFGMSSTPLYRDGVLYLQLLHGDGDPKTREAKIVALEATTGKEIWAVDRPSDGSDENEHSYASPIFFGDGNETVLVTHGADYTVGHRLSDGAEVWRMSGLNPSVNYDRTLRFVASPAAAGDLLVIPTAKRGPVMGIKPRAGKDLFKSDAHLWQWERTPDVPSPLILDDLVYLCMHDGNLNVLEAATGKEVYFERTHRQRHRASPVYADGHIYLTARDGKVTVVKTGRKFEIVAENEIPEPISSSPAISNGTLYLRTFENLYAIRNPARK
jgi:outer membrane protein assembly factor BamB